MARPLKKGLDYFPMECQLDEDFEALEAQFGNDGFAIIVKFWQAAFQTPKGQIDLNRPGRVERLARRANVEINRYLDVLHSAALLGLIDKDSYENLGILTSRGVRKRHQFIQNERLRWRKNKAIISGDNGMENSGNDVEKTPGSARETGIKKRKEKESKENKTGESARAKNLFKARPENPEAVSSYMRELGIPDPEGQTQVWFDHYASVGWKVGRNPMRDWRAAVRNWKRRIPEMHTAAAQRSATGFAPSGALTAEEIGRQRVRERVLREQAERERKERELVVAAPPKEFFEQLEKLASKMQMPRVAPEEINAEE